MTQNQKQAIEYIFYMVLVFPYHKWFTRVLESAQKMPAGFMGAVNALLQEKTKDNITAFFDLVRTYKDDWNNGWQYNALFVRDTEQLWMRGEEFIENI